MEREVGEGRGREGEGMKKRGRRGGGGEMRGIIMVLFLMINIFMISCGNGGPEAKELREGQAATADGTVINLKKVSDNITDAVAFLIDVEEVESMIKSIGDLAKAIGKKIHSSGGLRLFVH